MSLPKYKPAPQSPTNETTALKPPTRQLIAGNLDRLRRIAHHVHRRCDGSVELDDLIAWGAEGLISAAHRFDPDRGAPFANFAARRIYGAIYDGLRRARRVAERECSLDEEPAGTSGYGSWRVPREKLEGALAQLPLQQRAILRAHYLEGSSIRDVGRALGISRSDASREHRLALRSLRAALAS